MNFNLFIQKIKMMISPALIQLIDVTKRYRRVRRDIA